MEKSSENNNTTKNVITGVIIALIAGSSSPWWFEKLFSNPKPPVYDEVPPKPKSNKPFITGNIYGGPHGFQFNDTGDIPDLARVTGVTIFHGSLIDDIDFSWNGSALKPHGVAQKGGSSDPFFFEPDEYITSITGFAGRDQYQTSDVICKVTINTNKRCLGTYGMTNFPNGAMVNDNFRLNAPKGHKIVGIYGRADRFLNAIGIVVESL